MKSIEIKQEYFYIYEHIKKVFLIFCKKLEIKKEKWKKIAYINNRRVLIKDEYIYNKQILLYNVYEPSWNI